MEERDLLGDKSPRYAVSLPDLAATLGLSIRSVNQLAVAGVVVRTGRGEYDLQASVRNYIDKLKKPEGDSKERLTAAQADLAELKLQEARNELVQASEVETKWASILSSLRASFMGIPARVQTQLGHLSQHDVELIDREIRDTLLELGGNAD
jgi:terminase small subunit / prophage DNA-packing protein